MAQWLPRRLINRMIGILLLGLILAQMLNRTIHLYQHREKAEQSSQIYAAHRVADLILLMSALRFDTKQAIAEQFQAPFLRIHLIQKKTFLNRAGDTNNPKFKVFRTTLQTLLGKKYPQQLTFSELSPHTLLLTAQLKDHTTLMLQTDLMHYVEEDSSLLVHLAIILTAIMGFSFVAVQWVTRPLQALANAAENLGNDIHQPPLEETGPIEVARAAHAFNTMQARIVQHLNEKTQLLAAISHDLKTPITRLRLRSELLADDDTRLRFQKDLDEMESMVVATLDFMRGVDHQEAFQSVDMMALLESLQADAEEMHLKVNITGSVLSPYRGKPTALKRCLSNLIDNALKYGHCALLSVEDNAEWLIIRILDQGCGIPENQLEKVFEPYYRLETSRNRDTGGTGLGLSIAKEIAQAHAGKLYLSNTEKGGVEAVLTLPRGMTRGIN